MPFKSVQLRGLRWRAFFARGVCLFNARSVVNVHVEIASEGQSGHVWASRLLLMREGKQASWLVIALISLSWMTSRRARAMVLPILAGEEGKWIMQRRTCETLYCIPPPHTLFRTPLNLALNLHGESWTFCFAFFCQDLYVDPTELDCKHLFCYKCICDVLSQPGCNNKCPSCQSKITSKRKSSILVYRSGSFRVSVAVFGHNYCFNLTIAYKGRGACAQR